MKKTLRKNQLYSQGVFNPKNKEKYKGSLPVIYRSGLELKAFRWMDNNPNIISWGSESVIIPYISPLDKKMHRYFTDLVAHLRDNNNSIQKLIIEIKPSKFTKQPVFSPRKSQKTLLYEQTQYIINSAKWEAAELWCKKNGYIFIKLTEKHLDV